MLVIGGAANRHNGDKMTSSDTSSHHVVTKADVDAMKSLKIISQWLLTSTGFIFQCETGKIGEQEVTFRSWLGFIGAAQRSAFCPVFA